MSPFFLVLGQVLLAFEPAGFLFQTESTELLAPGAKLEKVWDEGAFTEGGAMDAQGGILFSDIGDRMMRFDPVTGKTTVHRAPSKRSNGLIFDAQGRLIVAEGANTGGGRRVSITEPDGTIRTLADRYEGKRFNSPNDVAVDRQGRVYVSDPRYVGDEPRELDFEGVFLIAPDGKVTRVETGARKPNGLVLSPDGKTLYVADTGSDRHALLACSVRPDGTLGASRVLVDFGAGRGIDGMTVTDDGRIVAASAEPLRQPRVNGAAVDRRQRQGVVVFSPAGRVLGFIPTPETPANVEFGGRGRSILYIMAGKSLYRIPTRMRGFALWPLEK